MRREARSTANHSQNLRLRWPTKGRISSSSKAIGFAALGLFRPATREPGRGQRRFFYLLDDRHPRHARRTHGAAFGKLGGDIGILRRFGHGCGHKPTLALGLATLCTVAADVFAAAADSYMFRINRALIHIITLQCTTARI